MEGELYCWGGTGQPELTDLNYDSPTPFWRGLTLTTLAASGITCAADTDGQAHCSGFTFRSGASLGDGTPSESELPLSEPVQVAGGHEFTQLAAGGGSSRTCGVTTEGRILCWGESWLDDGRQVSLLMPVEVATP